MSEVRIGIGHSGYYSYWLYAYNESGEKVWEGLVDAKQQTAPDGTAGLNVKGMPHGLKAAYHQYGTLRTEWEPAWEEVIPEQLPASVSNE